MANTCDGISHVILNAPTVDAYAETLRFYSTLGFRTVMEPATKSEPEELSTPEEVWLNLYGRPPVGDLTIKLRYNPRAVLRQSLQGGDWRSEEAALCIVSRDIKALESVLKVLNCPYQKYTYPLTEESLTHPTFQKPDDPAAGTSSEDMLVEYYTQDPLNNLLVFTNRAHPFSKTIEHPADTASAALAKEEKRDTRSVQRKIGVLTSGGDSPGMNAAVRAVVRVAIANGCEAFAIYDGYKGLVEGGNSIKRVGWNDVHGYLSMGGTAIGTARCMEFKTREGRLSAAQNLIINEIDSLVVCGGDGSLTGADIFRAEWPSLVDELYQNHRITTEQASKFRHLTIVGLVGSIDNDMASTDLTIGATSSLHRICESVDSITSTAMSHSRAFVVEVMGRHCGWLALMAAISTDANHVFIPERPPQSDDWESDLCESIQRNRSVGKRHALVIVAEGAIDKHLKPIKAEYIRDLLQNRIGLDTRVTTLGHVQRGGVPCANDRLLATLQGRAAVEAVLRSTPDTPSPMIGTSQNAITVQPLMRAVELTQDVAKAIAQKNFRRAMDLRDPLFAGTYDAYVRISRIMDHVHLLPEHQRLRIAIIHVGAPAAGMNAATTAAVRYCINHGHTPLAAYNGFSGLIAGEISAMDWHTVDEWMTKGGSELGTNRSQPDEDMGLVAYQLQKHDVQALMIIGGFEGYTALLKLYEARSRYPALCIPIVHLPATISNNAPGTDYSLGSDTGLNAIVEACDRITQSATASRKRVFVVEVMGGKTGYLAVMGGLASGAASVYIPEEGISLSRLQKDVTHLKRLFRESKGRRAKGRLILRNEEASKTYTTDVISAIFEQEGEGLFDSRTAILGHTQQGGVPSPLDRIRACFLAVRCMQFLEEHSFPAIDEAHAQGNPRPAVLCRTPQSAAVIGIRQNLISLTPCTELLADTDMKNRKSRQSWWAPARTLVDLLAKKDVSDPDEVSLSP
ncbi:uncharacterized protein VTP21DRAFT_768 [Calcarisporiella thermophila]|uniref:uncharacterized protein n=1 Tax=Calcarisporiella thermophila TaxID=911321 RepID=UPI0037431659